MTEAEKAYAEAERMIEDVRESGARSLSFDTDKTHTLNQLPKSIATLPFLRLLDCSSTGISDLYPLSGMTQLELLWLDGAPVDDLTPLSSLVGLTNLALNDTSVSDLSALKSLTRLRVLRLDGTPVLDIGPLSSLTEMTTLRLEGTFVTDLAPLKRLSGLKSLRVHQTPVSDLTPLSGLTGLTALRLNETSVSDLTPISGLTGLVEMPSHFGLRFDNCAAAQIDPRIAEIAEIQDNAERARTLFAYLEDWVPPGDAEILPSQIPDGFEHAVVQGRIGFVSGGAEADTDAQDLFDLLREDLDALLDACPSGDNAPYKSFRKMLEAYGNALGVDLSDIRAPRLWNAGNKLRLELKADESRSDLVLDGAPKLSEELQTGLDALVALHNVFASTHPRLAALDDNRPDPLDRPDADAARAQMEALIDAITPQVRVVMEEVIEEYKALHASSEGVDPFAARALAVERDSLNNFIILAVREALKEERKPGALQVTLSDVRAASVGAVVTEAGPFVAATLPHLVTVLAPHMGALMAATHAQDYPVRQTLEWIVNKVRERARRYQEGESDEDDD